MKLLTKTTLPALKDNFKFNDKIYVTSNEKDADGFAFVDTKLYMVSKVNIKTLTVIDQWGDTHLFNPFANGIKVTFAKH